MKKISVLVLALMLCLAMGTNMGALAQDNSTKVLGTWIVELPDEGTFGTIWTPDGIGQSFIGEQPTDDTVYMGSVFAIREQFMLGGELGEDGKPQFEVSELQYVDENTLSSVRPNGWELTFIRTETSTATEMALSNDMIGIWEADLPDAAGISRMEYRTDATMDYDKDGTTEAFSYVVLEDTLGIVNDQGEHQLFTFVVNDEDTREITELSSGTVLQYHRVAEEADAAA